MLRDTQTLLTVIVGLSVRWDARSDEEYLADSDSHESETDDEDSPVDVILYYDTNDEASILSTSDESDNAPPFVNDESVSSE